MKTLFSLLGFLLACGLSFGAESKPVPTLNGILVVGGSGMAALQIGESPQRWFASGEAIGEYRVTSVDAAHDRVTLIDAAQATHEIYLESARVKDQATLAQKTLLTLGQLDWKWINSGANPMHKTPESLPDWASRNWAAVTPDELLALRNYYRLHGWDAHWTLIQKGVVHGSYARLVDPSAPAPAPEGQRTGRGQNTKTIIPLPSS